MILSNQMANMSLQATKASSQEEVRSQAQERLINKLALEIEKQTIILKRVDRNILHISRDLKKGFHNIW